MFLSLKERSTKIFIFFLRLKTTTNNKQPEYIQILNAENQQPKIFETKQQPTNINQQHTHTQTNTLDDYKLFFYRIGQQFFGFRNNFLSGNSGRKRKPTNIKNQKESKN